MSLARRDYAGALLRWPSSLLIIIVSTCWGTSFVAIRYALGYMAPLTLGVTRAILASVMLLAVAGLAGARAPASPDLRGIIWAGVFMTGLSTALLIIGLERVTSGLGALLVNATPLFLVLLAALLLKERPSATDLAGLVISSTGVALICLPSIAGRTSMSGVILILLSALTGALGSVMLKRYPSSSTHPGMAMGIQLAISAVLIGVMAVLLGGLARPAGDVGWRFMVALLWTAGPGVALAFLIWAELLRRHSGVAVTASLLLTPVVAGLVGLALLGEPMSGVELVGGAVVLAGVALIGRSPVLERPP